MLKRAPRLSLETRREQVLEAATRLFARRGFEGTTTRHLAREAGINEAILFRLFPSKEDLYWAVIERKSRLRGNREKLERHLSSGRTDAHVFADIAEELLNRDTSMSRLLLFSALENHKLSQRFFRNYVAEYYERLADYIRIGMADGRFRKADPLLAARGFLGMVVYHFLIQELFGGKKYQKFDSAHVGRVFAEHWLEGMQPRTESRASSNGRATNGNGARGKQ